MKIFGKELLFNNKKVYHEGNKPTAADIGAAAASHSHSYLPLSGGTLTGDLKYSGGGYTGNAIMFADGSSTGAFIGIGAGGTTVIGSGESVATVKSNTTAYDSEKMIVAADSGIEFYTGIQSGYDVKKTVSITTAGVIDAPQGVSGNASTATTLQTARTINGTSFNGSANITTANWGTARTITIGSTGKSVNGSANVSWSLAEIGAAAASHSHSYVPLSGGTMTGDLNIKKSDGSASKLNVYRTLNSKVTKGVMDIYAYGNGAVSLSTWNTTDNTQDSSYVFSGDAFFAPTRTGETARPEIGTSELRFEKAWLNKLDAKEAIFTSGTLTAQGKVTVGSSIVVGRGSNIQAIVVNTAGDANGSGDGETHLGYYSNGVFHHYFRGKGNMNVDMNLKASALWVGGKRISVGTSAHSSPATGDIWIQI